MIVMLDTSAVHEGEPTPRIGKAVSLPIFQTSTYVRDGANDPVQYVRYGSSPNHEALNKKLASITITDEALVTSSGMAAITSTLLGLLQAGDHLVASRNLYGGTLELLGGLSNRLNIKHSFLPNGGVSDWDSALTRSTKVLYTESITNPKLDIPDLESMLDFADEHDLITVIDNTFGTPVNIRPAALGFDLVLHSATKYLNGHSDVAAGVVAGRSDLLERINSVLTLSGSVLDPHACFLLHRGLKTLGIRVGKQNASAQKLAEVLDSHRAVDTTFYPGLESHPARDCAQDLFEGFGGMVTFSLDSSADADTFLKSLKLPLRAPSLGGIETLITRPSDTSHRNLSPERREKLGITDNLFRLSVGIENVKDLIGDVTGALNSALCK